MHPNCRCSIIAVEEELYNYQTQFNPYGFIPALQNAINDPYAKLWGNVFILHSNHSQDSINSSKLQPIAPYVENPILIDYDKISSDLSTWWENYCNDAITFFNAIVAGSEERFGIAFGQIAENGILGVPYLLDAASLGMVSVLKSILDENLEQYKNDKNFENFLNLITFDTLEMVQNTLNPDEPLSFWHTLDSIGTISLFFGGITTRGIGMVDDAARIGAGQIDDVARVAVRSIDDLVDTANFTDNALTHIFDGEVNSREKAVGFHYEGFPTSKGTVVAGTETPPNQYGVYRAEVQVDGITKIIKNTDGNAFFPKDWTAQQVVDAINEAYGKRTFQKGNTYSGTLQSGMTIEMFLDKNGKIISAFPKYP